MGRAGDAAAATDRIRGRPARSPAGSRCRPVRRWRRRERHATHRAGTAATSPTISTAGVGTHGRGRRPAEAGRRRSRGDAGPRRAHHAGASGASGAKGAATDHAGCDREARRSRRRCGSRRGSTGGAAAAATSGRERGTARAPVLPAAGACRRSDDHPAAHGRRPRPGARAHRARRGSGRAVLRPAEPGRGPHGSAHLRTNPRDRPGWLARIPEGRGSAGRRGIRELGAAGRGAPAQPAAEPARRSAGNPGRSLGAGLLPGIGRRHPACRGSLPVRRLLRSVPAGPGHRRRHAGLARFAPRPAGVAVRSTGGGGALSGRRPATRHKRLGRGEAAGAAVAEPAAQYAVPDRPGGLPVLPAGRRRRGVRRRDRGVPQRDGRGRRGIHGADGAGPPRCCRR